MNKRTFLKSLGVLGLAAAARPVPALNKWIDMHSHIPANKLASEENFWSGIRQGYRLKPDYINLENGYYCIQPEETLENFIQHVRDVNYEGSHYMRTVQWKNKKK